MEQDFKILVVSSRDFKFENYRNPIFETSNIDDFLTYFNQRHYYDIINSKDIEKSELEYDDVVIGYRKLTNNNYKVVIIGNAENEELTQRNVFSISNTLTAACTKDDYFRFKDLDELLTQCKCNVNSLFQIEFDANAYSLIDVINIYNEGSRDIAEDRDFIIIENH